MKKLFRQIAFFCIVILYGTSCLTESETKETSASVKIGMEELSDGHQFFYQFSLPDGLVDSGTSLYWTVDQGDPVKAPSLVMAFSDSRKHMISVHAEPQLSGHRLEKLSFTPKAVILPSTKIYLTIDKPDGLFVLPGEVTEFRGLKSKTDSLISVGASVSPGVYRMATTGFHLLTVSAGANKVDYNIFVSPVPSVHLDRTDRDWYYTQWHTKTTSNCGPTVVSMGLAWANNLDISVPQVRDIVGWTGAGGVNFVEMKSVFDKYGVKSEIVKLTSVQDFFTILEKGHMLGIVYDMAGLPKVDNPGVNLMGQYYTDHGGHYLALKGYSLDKKYVIIQDPIPSDWKYNRERYADGESMWGRNRYYPAQKLFDALLSTDAIEVYPAQ